MNLFTLEQVKYIPVAGLSVNWCPVHPSGRVVDQSILGFVSLYPRSPVRGHPLSMDNASNWTQLLLKQFTPFKQITQHLLVMIQFILSSDELLFASFMFLQQQEKLLSQFVSRLERVTIYVKWINWINLTSWIIHGTRDVCVSAAQALNRWSRVTWPLTPGVCNSRVPVAFPLVNVVKEVKVTRVC